MRVFVIVFLVVCFFLVHSFWWIAFLLYLIVRDLRTVDCLFFFSCDSTVPWFVIVRCLFIRSSVRVYLSFCVAIVCVHFNLVRAYSLLKFQLSVFQRRCLSVRVVTSVVDSVVVVHYYCFSDVVCSCVDCVTSCASFAFYFCWLRCTVGELSFTVWLSFWLSVCGLSLFYFYLQIAWFKWLLNYIVEWYY